jgi:uncharacterized protein YegL
MLGVGDVVVTGGDSSEDDTGEIVLTTRIEPAISGGTPAPIRALAPAPAPDPDAAAAAPVPAPAAEVPPAAPAGDAAPEVPVVVAPLPDGVSALSLEGEPAAPVAPAAPPRRRIERWNSILDESPVFAGQGAFEVQTPAGMPEGSLDVAIGVRFEIDSVPADSDPIVHMLVTLSPFGAPLMAGRSGPVAHVVLALDLSASMDRPDKYPLLREALSGMFRDLRGRWSHEVLVSVVAFAYGAETLVHAVPSSRLDEQDVLARLDAWDKRFTRYTDLAGALHRAGRIARDSVAANRAMPVRIYVLTDGRPQDMPAAREVTSLVSRLPVDVHALAFGDDADVELLGQLVCGGRGGTVKHVRSDTIGDAFGRIGEVAQMVVANRALLDVELRPGVTGGAAFRHRPARHRYPANSFVRGTHFATDLGTLESGRTYTMLFQLRLRRTRNAETEVGRITLRVPGFGGPRTFEKVVSVHRHPGSTVPERDPEVQAAIDVLAAIEGDDPAAKLQSLRIRRELYARERRDPHVLFVLDKAILELEQHGSLAALSASEQATLASHTLTTHVRGAVARRAPGPGAKAVAADAGNPGA